MREKKYKNAYPILKINAAGIMAGNTLKARTIAILGSREVGKSSLIIQFVENHFVESYQPSVETTFRKVIRYKGHEVEAEIIDTAGRESVPIVLVGNKMDLHQQRQLTFEEGKNLASHWQCAWTEASAKRNDNITRIFKLMINEMEKDINPNNKEL
ncbi:44044_t:CDS:2, partial [Gigaspora margarita]